MRILEGINSLRFVEFGSVCVASFFDFSCFALWIFYFERLCVMGI